MCYTSYLVQLKSDGMNIFANIHFSLLTVCYCSNIVLFLETRGGKGSQEKRKREN